MVCIKLTISAMNSLSTVNLVTTMNGTENAQARGCTYITGRTMPMDQRCGIQRQQQRAGGTHRVRRRLQTQDHGIHDDHAGDRRIEPVRLHDPPRGGEAAPVCVAYVTGFLDGAVVTDARVAGNVANEIDADETFSERAIPTRIIRRLEVSGPRLS